MAEEVETSHRTVITRDYDGADSRASKVVAAGRRLDNGLLRHQTGGFAQLRSATATQKAWSDSADAETAMACDGSTSAIGRTCAG